MPRAPTSPSLGAAADPSSVASGKKTKRKQEAEAEQVVSMAVEEAATKQGKRKAKQEAGAAQEEEAEEAPPAKKKKEKKKAAVAEEAVASTSADGASAGDVMSPDAFRKKHEITSAREDQSLPDPVQRFEDAPFSKKIKAGLAAAGFAAPSPIQAQGWAVAVLGQDLVAVAKTGSGKTLGFLLPACRAIALSELPEPRGSAAEPLALVLAPTRELVAQIEAECAKFLQYSKVTSLAVFGGAAKGPQVKACKDHPQVLIATPGRLQDLMEMTAVNLKNVSFLVLDEADRMLDMGFEPEIAKIIATCAPVRQTLMFTATWSKAVQRIANSYLKAEHMHVNVGATEELSANKAVTQEFFKIGDEDKEVKLWRIISDLPEDAKLIAFMNTKRRVEQYSKAFNGRGFEVAALHGDKRQDQRDKDLAEFSTGKVWLLFATDVCARGLDIKSVTHVVNFDMARDVESYVHRIGRTGRAGNTGKSITFWNEAYDTECAPALAKIAKEAGQEVPDFLQKAADKQTQVKNKLWKY